VKIQNLETFASETLNRMDDLRARERSVSKRKDNWASDLFHPCLRYLVYSRLRWKDKKLPDVDLIYRFEEGNEVEKRVRRYLSDIGVEIHLAQQYFSWDKYQIVGRIDGKIKINGDHLPVEIKSISPYFWESTKTITDIRDHKSLWMRRIIAQLNLYLLMDNSEFGFLVLSTFGKRPRILPMQIDLEIGEQCIQTAERVNEFVELKETPKAIPYDSGVCDRCAFEHVCLPLKTTKFDGTIDPEYYKKLLRHYELKPDAKEFDKLDKDIKKQFRGQNIISGEFKIESKEYEIKFYNVPDEVKSQYAEKKSAIRMSITKIG